MGKLKKIFKNGRVILLLVFIVFAIWAIQPRPWQDGLAIRSIVPNSSASLGGLESPPHKIPPVARERIESMIIDFKEYPIKTLEDYYEAIEKIRPNKTYKIVTNKNTYTLLPKLKTRPKVLGELVEKNITYYDNKTQSNVTKTISVNKTIHEIIGVEDPGIFLFEAPKSNLRLGLDLQGGTRVLLEPDEQLTNDEFEILKSNMEQRLNVYGLSDISVRIAKDKPAFLGGKSRYILVEIPGANEQEVKELLSKQGKFEAKIGNQVVFKGGTDITYVCRSADCSGIDPRQGCSRVDAENWACRFFFTIALTPEAAQRQADITKNLKIKGTGANRFLEKPLELFLDDVKVDELNIGADLRGRAVTDIQISGSGQGKSQQLAMFNALDNMKKLQTILITGSLPVKMNIIRTDNISPVLGHEFIKNSLFVGFLALLAVSLVIYLRYRKLILVLPTVITILCEILMLLGFAALVAWNLDLAAIAGIIIASGTAVDHLVVIIDETLGRERSHKMHWKEKLKSAFFIITGAYLTTSVAMLPLWFAGAGLLKGFAFTTIVGLTIGVFIARPAFAKVMEILLEQ